MKIAIIGAGIGGLTLARELAKKANVTLFEKARGVGGRMSTRYADPFYFDHGAQCFTARSKEFQAFLKPYMDAGIVAEWKGKVINLELGKKETKRMWFEPHLVASPNMNSLCKKLAEGINIFFSKEVAPLDKKEPEGWALQSKEGEWLGVFDWVISTAPPAQTLRLFNDYIAHGHPLHSSQLQGCYSLMIGFNKPWDRTWIAAKVRNNPIKWISVNSSKPGRSNKVTCLVVHSRNEWAEANIDNDIDEAQKFLLQQFGKVTGIKTDSAEYISTHRWRYAIVEETEKSGIYIDNTLGLAATSDWCRTSRVEDVWQHAQDLAALIRNEKYFQEKL